MLSSREQGDELLGLLVVFCWYFVGVAIVADLDGVPSYPLPCGGVCEDETIIAELLSVEEVRETRVECNGVDGM